MATDGYLLDTTALIDALRGRESTVSLIAGLIKESPVSICIITIAEIYSGIRASEIKKAERFLDSLILYLIDGSIARRAGLYQRDYRRKGINLALADCLIAAVAVERNLVLLTNNVCHFPMPELSIIEH